MQSPERDIGYLLSDVSRLLRREFDRRVRDLELTQAQWRAIAHLAREEGINQSMLAERLEVQPITLARLIDRMELAGWVRREADSEDKRVSLLFLTDKVTPILDELQSHAREALADLMSGVSRTARHQLLTTLERMKQNLIEAQLAADSRADLGTRNHGGRGKGSKRGAAGHRAN